MQVPYIEIPTYLVPVEIRSYLIYRYSDTGTGTPYIEILTYLIPIEIRAHLCVYRHTDARSCRYRDHRTMMPRGEELHALLSQQQVGRPISGVKYTPRGWTFVHSAANTARGAPHTARDSDAGRTFSNVKKKV